MGSASPGGLMLSPSDKFAEGNILRSILFTWFSTVWNTRLPATAILLATSAATTAVFLLIQIVMQQAWVQPLLTLLPSLQSFYIRIVATDYRSNMSRLLHLQTIDALTQQSSSQPTLTSIVSTSFCDLPSRCRLPVLLCAGGRARGWKRRWILATRGSSS